MKKTLLLVFVAAFFLLVSGNVNAAVKVKGYYKSNGTYVNSYYRSNPDSSRLNNYSTRGNINPYTGTKGYVNPYKSYTPTYRYYSHY